MATVQPTDILITSDRVLHVTAATTTTTLTGSTTTITARTAEGKSITGTIDPNDSFRHIPMSPKSKLRPTSTLSVAVTQSTKKQVITFPERSETTGTTHPKLPAPVACHSPTPTAQNAPTSTSTTQKKHSRTPASGSI